MFRNDGERRSFSVVRNMTVIGRREDCDLRIPVGDVSRKHCRLVRTDDGIRVEDLGSSNGTYVNGERIQECDLNPGDNVGVGPVQFIVQIDGVPNEDEMTPPGSAVARHSDSSVADSSVADQAPLELSEETPTQMVQEDASLDKAEAVPLEEITEDEFQIEEEPVAAEEAPMVDFEPVLEADAEPLTTGEASEEKGGSTAPPNAKDSRSEKTHLEETVAIPAEEDAFEEPVDELTFDEFELQEEPSASAPIAPAPIAPAPISPAPASHRPESPRPATASSRPPIPPPLSIPPAPLPDRHASPPAYEPVDIDSEPTEEAHPAANASSHDESTPVEHATDSSWDFVVEEAESDQVHDFNVDLDSPQQQPHG